MSGVAKSMSTIFPRELLARAVVEKTGEEAKSYILPDEKMVERLFTSERIFRHLVGSERGGGTRDG